jgi:hypothetical protein
MKSGRRKRKPPPHRVHRSRYPFVVVNGLAAVAMAFAAARVPAWLTLFYPVVLTWVPAAAFCCATMAWWRRTPAWSLPALVLNLGSVLLFCGFGLVAVTDWDVARLGLPFAVPGAALAALNLYRLSAMGIRTSWS